MSCSRIAYIPRSDATSETEAANLASIYRFILDTAARKKAGVTSTGNDERGESQSDSHAKPSVP